MTTTAPHPAIADFDRLLFNRFGNQRGWYCLGYIDGDPRAEVKEPLQQEWYFYPRDRQEIAERYAQLAERQLNLYWAACLFKTRRRNYKNALPSPWLWQDDAPADARCSELIQTSEQSYQALIRLDRPATAEERQRLQEAWRDKNGADACSKDAVHMGRLPGGYNRKRHGCYLVHTIAQSDLVWSADTLLAALPKVEPKASAEITPINRPGLEKHLANIAELLDSGRAKCIKPDSQTGRILAGERVAIASKHLNRMDDSASAQIAILAYGFYCRGFMDDEIAAVCLHFYREWGTEKRKGTAWCISDIERCIALAKAQKPGVVQSPTRYKAAQPVELLLETPAPSRARHDRPTKYDALMLLSRYHQQPEICELRRKARAARLEISTATLDRLELELRSGDNPHIQIEARPGLPGRVILLGVINIPAPEVLSGPSAQSGDYHAPIEQTEESPPQCIEETHPPQEAPAAPAAPLDQWAADAGDVAIDDAEIDRMVAEIQTAQARLEAHRAADLVPHYMLAVNASERHEPQTYWERHEALTWRESHPAAPQTPAKQQAQQTKEEREKAQIRAKWDAMSPGELARARAILRNFVKSHPYAKWPIWQICELNERLAEYTPDPNVPPAPPAVEQPPIAEERVAGVFPPITQTLAMDLSKPTAYPAGFLSGMVERLRKVQVAQ